MPVLTFRFSVGASSWTLGEKSLGIRCGLPNLCFRRGADKTRLSFGLWGSIDERQELNSATVLSLLLSKTHVLDAVIDLEACLDR